MLRIGYNIDMYLLNPYIYGGASFASGNSLLFDAVDEYVDCGRVTATESTANISISSWVKVTSSGDILIWGKYLSSSNGFYCQFLDGNDLISMQLQNGSPGNGARLSANNSFLKNQWNHLVVVYDGTQVNADRIKIYINGSLSVGSLQGTIPTTTSSLTEVWQIASIGGFSGSYLGGNVDEHAVFDYSLTSGQVTSLYNSGVPTDLDNTSGVTAPIHWWRMGDGDTFPTITDVGTTGGNNGTMTNMEAGDIVTDTP